jgi:hypothetical protein
LIANPNLPAGQRAPSRWFNTDAFVAPPIFNDNLGAYSIPGNEGRNVITGPGLAAWDMSLERQARLSERLNLVFRSDFFNLTNHPNFDRPGLILPVSTQPAGCPGPFPNPSPFCRTSIFGKVSSAGNSRQVQFSLRLNW